MSDELRPDGRHRGWSDRLATGLAADRSGVAHYPVTYANLAIRGKLLDQVVAEQFGPALTLGPDIITFHAGANDVLRPGTDLPALYARYDAAVAELTSTGARVVLFTSLARAGGSGRFADRLERAFHAFNRNIREVAARHGATLVDLEAIGALTDRRFWAPDRLHLNDLGHARVAAAALAELGITDPNVLGGPPGWWTEPLPLAPPRSRRENLAGDVEWVLVHLVPWIDEDSLACAGARDHEAVLVKRCDGLCLDYDHAVILAILDDLMFTSKIRSAASHAGVSVTFEPGARTAWHTHPLGQTLIVTAGLGHAQTWGGPVEEIRPGDVVWFPPGEKHWHGASPATAMAHLAIQERLDGKAVEWLEHVTDDQYAGR